MLIKILFYTIKLLLRAYITTKMICVCAHEIYKHDLLEHHSIWVRVIINKKYLKIKTYTWRSTETLLIHLLKTYIYEY